MKGRLTQMKDAAVLSKFVQGGKLVTDRWKILEILNGIDADKYPTTITPETAPAPSEVAGVDNNFKMPQVWKSSIAFDWTLPLSFPVTITGEYIYNKTLNAVMLTNYNITDDNSGWATFNGADQRHIYPSNYKYNRTDAYILTNSNKGYGSVATIELKAEPVKGLDFIEKKLGELIPRIRVAAIPETLEYLHRGGRLSKTAYVAGSLAQVKPLITFEDGFVKVLTKAIGLKRAMLTLAKLLDTECDANYSIIPSYTYSNKNLVDLIKMVDHKFLAAMEHQDNLDPAIACHWGPNAFGLIFVRKQ